MDEYKLYIKRETDQAILVNDGEKDLWLPKRQIRVGGGDIGDIGDSGALFWPEDLPSEKKIQIPEWLAFESKLKG
jgi:hypothetical protein